MSNQSLNVHAARELNTKVAKALGYRPINVLPHKPNRDPDFWAPPGDSAEATRHPPAFCTTWAGAGLVIEAMRERGLRCSCFGNWNGGYEVVFEDKKCRVYPATADTAPLAICRAALVALGDQP